MTKLRHDKDTFFSSPTTNEKEWSGTACRVHVRGDALIYPRADGTASHEYRSLDELKNIAKQLNTGSIPIKVNHSGGPVGLVTSAKVVDGLCRVTFKLDAKNPDKLLRANPELSLGYETDLRSDGHHTNSIVRELSICPQARCGAACKVNLDGSRLDCGSCETCLKTAKAVSDALDLEAAAAVRADLAERESDDECDCDDDTDPEDRCDDCDPDDDDDEDLNLDSNSDLMALATARLRARTEAASRTNFIPRKSNSVSKKD